MAETKHCSLQASLKLLPLNPLALASAMGPKLSSHASVSSYCYPDLWYISFHTKEQTENGSHWPSLILRAPLSILKTNWKVWSSVVSARAGGLALVHSSLAALQSSGGWLSGKRAGEGEEWNDATGFKTIFLIKMKFTYHKINYVQVNISLAFSMFIMLYNHYLYLVSKHFHHSRIKPS